jgi:N-acetyl-anhydromuramyl-L-alanine amidase AmpD
MEAPEASTTAENVARWAAGPSAPSASWHYAIDDDSAVQCVKEEDIAWAAPGRNHNGIQLEHAGYARQTAEQWNDAFSMRMLERSAVITGGVCRRWDIPVVFVDAQGLLRGERGITTHWEVTKGPGRGLTSHTDPGVHFPMARYLELVQQALAALD